MDPRIQDDDIGRSFRRTNLNLLYTLDAVLRARTLTEAGQMIGLSQSATSMALRKLRDNFGDDLIVHGPGGRYLTALGEALRERVGAILRSADDAFNLSLDFDPATSVRTISIAAPEAIELTFLDRVVRRIRAEAPGVAIRLIPFDYDTVEAASEWKADLVITPSSLATSRCDSRVLFELDAAGLVCRDNERIGQAMTAGEYAAASHVALFPAIERTVLFGSAGDPLLARRHIAVQTGLHSMLPTLVVGTRLIATVSIWLAQHYAYLYPLRVIGLPLDAPPTPFVAQWQPHRAREPVIRWLVDRVLGAVDWGA